MIKPFVLKVPLNTNQPTNQPTNQSLSVCHVPGLPNGTEKYHKNFTQLYSFIQYCPNTDPDQKKLAGSAYQTTGLGSE